LYELPEFPENDDILLVSALLPIAPRAGDTEAAARRWRRFRAVRANGLVATPGNATVSLAWTASTGATGYYIKRSTTSGAETQIAAQAGTSYNDTTVTNGTKYFYVVAAYNSYGTSADSAEVNATPTVPAAVM